MSITGLDIIFYLKTAYMRNLVSVIFHALVLVECVWYDQDQCDNNFLVGFAICGKTCLFCA